MKYFISFLFFILEYEPPFSHQKAVYVNSSIFLKIIKSGLI